MENGTEIILFQQEVDILAASDKGLFFNISSCLQGSRKMKVFKDENKTVSASQ